jgi:hypothetical protein
MVIGPLCWIGNEIFGSYRARNIIKNLSGLCDHIAGVQISKEKKNAVAYTDFGGRK